MAEFHYRAYGMNIVSDWPLPSLAATSFEAADLIIRHECIAPYLDSEWQADKISYRNWESANGKFLMKVKDVADFLAIDGKLILVERCHANVCDDAVTAYMMGSMMAAVMQQRKISVLHASAVAKDDGALVFCGRSGAGKSTLAVKMADQGCPLIADDVVPLQKNGLGQICATPAFPTSRLWEDSLKQLSHNDNVKQRVRPELDKFLVTAENYCDVSLPIRAVYILRPSNQPEICITHVPVKEASEKFVKQGFRNGFLRANKAHKANFEMVMALTKKTPLFEVERSQSGFAIDELVDAISRHSAALSKAT